MTRLERLAARYDPLPKPVRIAVGQAMHAGRSPLRLSQRDDVAAWELDLLAAVLDLVEVVRGGETS